MTAGCCCCCGEDELVMEAEVEEEEDEEGEVEGEGPAEGEAEEAGEIDKDGGGVALSRRSVLLASAFESGVGEGVAALVGDDEVGASSSSKVALMSATEGEEDPSSERKAMSTAMLSAKRCLLFHLLSASLITALTTSLGWCNFSSDTCS